MGIAFQPGGDVPYVWKAVAVAFLNPQVCTLLIITLTDARVLSAPFETTALEPTAVSILSAFSLDRQRAACTSNRSSAGPSSPPNKISKGYYTCPSVLLDAHLSLREVLLVMLATTTIISMYVQYIRY